MKARHLRPGMIFRRLSPHPHGWRICLSAELEEFDLDFVDIISLRQDGDCVVWAHFIGTELEVML